MTETTQVRELTPGDAITVEVLRDFLFTALRHGANRRRPGRADGLPRAAGQLDAVGLAAVLPELIGDVLHVARRQDWTAIAEVLIDAARDDLPGAEERR